MTEVDFRGLPAPIVQAGMGAVARHELAAAVSEAGGLGTIGGARGRIADELAAARQLTGQPIAVNLVLPLLRPGDVQAAADADVIVTFWGEPRRLASGTWVHQCGSVQEAAAAESAGADAVIAQGVEAGGHVRGTTPLLDLIESVRAAVKVPVLAAGGIVDQEGVRHALDVGADAAVLGTRFLLSEESRAHPDYKLRCLQADRTLLTELFGLGWAEAPHRVVPNAATRRWLGSDPRGPGWIRLANRLASPIVIRVPERLQDRGLAIQRPALPLLGPAMALDDGPASLVDSGPLYAGASVTRISDIRPAAQIVNDLTP
jgi:nitronate monooxygenase